MTRARVVHVVTRLDLGGAQLNTLHCMRHHDRARYEVELIAGQGGALDDEARGIDDARVTIAPWLVHAISPLDDAHALSQLTRHFERTRPHVVHTHASKAGVLGRLAAHTAGVPVVVHTAHGWSFNDTQRPLVRGSYIAIERVLARLTDRLYTVSARDRDRASQLGIVARAPIEVLRSGIDVARFARAKDGREAARRALGLSDDNLAIGSIGNLKPQKSPLDLVEAAALALASEPRLVFLVCGDGELKREVVARARARGITDRFRLLGWQSDPVKILAALDVYVLLSRFEGLPRSVLEAFAAGIPVVATAVDGTPEVVKDGETGVLVEPGDHAAAARGIVALARDRALARALCARAARVLDGDFDIARMLAHLERDYDALLSDAARSGASVSAGASRGGASGR